MSSIENSSLPSMKLRLCLSWELKFHTGGWFAANIVTLFDVHGDLQASMHLSAQLAENELLNAPAVRTLHITPATACVDIYRLL